MELKFNTLTENGKYYDSSNRTFMELKSQIRMTTYLLTLVLIVPLWN